MGILRATNIAMTGVGLLLLVIVAVAIGGWQGFVWLVVVFVAIAAGLLLVDNIVMNRRRRH